MVAPAFHRLRVKLSTAFAFAVRHTLSSISDPASAPSSERRSVGQGRTGFFIIIAIVIVCAVIVIGLPGWFGARAEKTYREAIRQTAGSGGGIKLDSYQRGWFSSRAVITVPLGSRSVVLTQRIHHGPFAFYDGWHLAFPVAAVVETDPPPAVRNGLDQTFGPAPLLIETVVSMNGALDTHVSRGPSERSRPGLTIDFRGFDLHWHLLHGTQRLSAQAPGITATGGFGEAQIAGISLHSEAHRHSTELWLGNGSLSARHVSYSIVARGRRPSLSGLAQDLSISVHSTLDNGRMGVRMAFGAGKVSSRTLELGPVMIEERISHISPKPLEQLRKDAVAISRSTADKASRTRMTRALRRKLLITIVKQSPVFAINFSVAGTGGKAVGKMRFGIAKDFANDPLVKDETANGKALMARAWSKYIHATADISVPVVLLARLASNAHIKDLQTKGILVREGADYTCHASLRMGKWTVNGKTFRPAAGLRPATAKRYRSKAAASATRS